MTAQTHLCPCCAAHLRIPAALHAMRCDNCDAELVYVAEGGVRGLALLPSLAATVPYSDPARPVHGRSFDGSELLYLRREVLLKGAERSFRLWSSVLTVIVMLMVGAMGVCALGMYGVVENRGRDETELAATAFLVAVMALPVLGYVALYFQARARLVRERIRRSLS